MSIFKRHNRFALVTVSEKSGEKTRVIMAPELYPDFFDKFLEHLSSNNMKFDQRTIDMNERVCVQEERSYDEYVRTTELVLKVEKELGQTRFYQCAA